MLPSERESLLAPPLPRSAHWTGWAGFGLVAILIAGTLPFTWFLHDRPVRDEVYHIPVVRSWAEHPEQISLTAFHETKGFGLFLIATGWAKVFGSSCAALRTLTGLMALGALASWTWLTGLWGLSRRFTAVVALAAVPYFFVNTQLFHTEVPALFTVLLGLCCLENLRRSGRWRWAVAMTLCLAAAPWIRQTMLVVLAALAAWSWNLGRYRWRCAGAALISMISVAPMLYCWGGLVPSVPARTFIGGGIYPDTFAFALAVTGAMAWPILLAGRPERVERLAMLVGAALAGGLFLTQPLDYRSDVRMGLFQKFLASLPGPDWTPRAVLLVALVVGGVVLARLVCFAAGSRQPHWVRLASVLALARLILCGIGTPVFFDRYLLLTFVMVYGIAAERASRLLAWAFIAAFLLVAASHAAYITRRPDLDGLTPLELGDFTVLTPVEKTGPATCTGPDRVPFRAEGLRTEPKDFAAASGKKAHSLPRIRTGHGPRGGLLQNWTSGAEKKFPAFFEIFYRAGTDSTM